MEKEENLYIALSITITLIIGVGLFLLFIFPPATTESDGILKTIIPDQELFDRQSADRERSSTIFQSPGLGLTLTYPSNYRLISRPISQDLTEFKPAMILLSPESLLSAEEPEIVSISDLTGPVIAVLVFDNPAGWSTRQWLSQTTDIQLESTDQPQWFLYDGRQMAWLEAVGPDQVYDIFLIPSQDYRQIFAFTAVYPPTDKTLKSDLMTIIENATID